MQPLTVFHAISLACVAAPADIDLLAQWETHLLPLKQAGLITFWSQQHLLPGEDVMMGFSERLAQADCIILLISADFFANDVCMQCMERALSYHQTKSSVVVSLLLRPVEWHASALSSFPFLPRTSIPATQWPNLDQAFHICIQELHWLLRLSSQPIHIPMQGEAIYRQQVVKAYNWLNFAGFGKGDQMLTSVSLEDIFIQLNLTVEPVSRGQQEQAIQESMALVDALKTNLLLVGEPGAGKSILLRWLAVTFAQQRQGEPDRLGPLAQQDYLPLLVELGHLPEPYLSAESGVRLNWIQMIPTLLSQQQAFSNLSPHLLTSALQSGHCLLLFDGLDEIAHAQARLRVARSIAELARIFPQHRILVGSRPAGVTESDGALHEFRRCNIARFTPEEIRRFFNRWYSLDQPASPEQQVAIDRLYTALETTPHLLDLAGTPLLCTILLLIWRNEQTLPERRVDLYERCCQTLLDPWEHHHEVIVHHPLAALKWEGHLRLLAPLAYAIHERGYQADRKELLNQLEKSLLAEERVRSKKEATDVGEEYLDWLASRSGLLLFLGNNQYRFSHHTFQEYLAARYIAEQPDFIDLVKTHLHEGWWREVHLLTIGHLGAQNRTDGKAEQLLLAILRTYPLPSLFWRTSRSRLLRFLTLGRYFPDFWWRRHITWILCREVELVIHGYQECHPEASLARTEQEIQQLVPSLVQRYLYDDTSGEVMRPLINLLFQTRCTVNNVRKILHNALDNRESTVRIAAKQILNPRQAGERVLPTIRKLLMAYRERIPSIKVYPIRHYAIMHWNSPEEENYRHEFNDHISGLLEVLKSDVEEMQVYWEQIKETHLEVVKILLEAIRDEDEGVCDVAIVCLTIYLTGVGGTDQEIVQMLLSALHDKHSTVRATIAERLREAARTNLEVIKTLLVILHDEHPTVCVAAATTLTEIARINPEALRVALDSLYDRDEMAITDLKVTTETSLGGIRTLLPALRDKHPTVRVAAIMCLQAYLERVGGTNQEVTNILLSVLQDKNQNVRAAALLCLHSYLPREGIGWEVTRTLLDALRDEDKDMRLAAIASLEEAVEMSPEVTRTFLQALHNEDKDVCAIVAQSLGHAAEKNSKIAEVLLDFLRDEDKGVRLAAITGLHSYLGGIGRTSQENSTTFPEFWYDKDTSAAMGLKEVIETNPEIVRAILQALSDKDNAVRTTAATILEKIIGMDPEVMGILWQTLRDKDKAVHVAATSSKDKNLGVVQVLLDASHDNIAGVRVAAIVCLNLYLARNGGMNPKIAETFLQALSDENKTVRKAAAASLKKVVGTDLEIVADLRDALYDEDGEVRAAAATSLQTVVGTNPEVVQALLHVLQDDNFPEVRVAAATSLQTIVGTNTEVVENLQNAFHDGDRDVCLAIISSLKEVVGINPMLADDILYFLQFIHNRAVWQAVASNLAQIAGGYPGTIEILLKVFNNSHGDVQVTALLSLEKMKARYPKVVDMVLRHHSLLPMVSHAYKRYPPLSYLLAQIVHWSETLINVLFTTNHRSHFGSLYERADSSLKEAVRTKPDFAKVLIDALNNRDEKIRKVATECLGEVVETDPEAVKALLLALHDRDKKVRIAVAHSLKKAVGKNSEVEKALLSALHDRDKKVREAIVHALRKANGTQPELVMAELSYFLDSGWIWRSDNDVMNQIVQTLQEPELRFLVIKKLNSRLYYLNNNLRRKVLDLILLLLDGQPLPQNVNTNFILY